MATVQSYPVRPFTEQQKFFVYDPASQTSSLVTGADIKQSIQAGNSAVVATSTFKALKTESYAIGTIIQTSGGNAIGDTSNGLYVIQPPGSGGTVIFNGNEAVELPLVNFVVSDVSSATVVNDSGTRTIEVLADAVDLKIFRATNAAGVAALPAVAGYQVLMSGAPSGLFEFSTTNFASAVGNDPGKLVYIPPSSDVTGASGAWVKKSGTEVGEVITFAGNAASLNRKYGQGWRIADGTAGTPNLMDAFPKFGTFAQKSDTGGAKTVTPAGSVSVSTSVSVSNHTLSVAQMPSHNHNQRISVDSPGMDNLTVPLANQASDTTSGGNTGSAGSSNSHNHGSSASSSGSFSGSNHTNEPQFTYLVPLYFTGVAGTYP